VFGTSYGLYYSFYLVDLGIVGATRADAASQVEKYLESLSGQSIADTTRNHGSSRMPGPFHVALVGDYDSSVPAHQATLRALAYAASQQGVELAAVWLATDTITATWRAGHIMTSCIRALGGAA
jgi:CTP synthase (UTP-ammonia lyase)